MPVDSVDSQKKEEILSRIRERLREPAVRMEAKGDPQPGSMAGITQACASPGPCDFGDHIANCYALQEVIGEVTPRPSGRVNELIQLVKRAIRRCLSWYTRPIRDFARAVTQSLVHLNNALEEQQTRVINPSVERLTAIERDLRRIAFVQDQIPAKGQFLMRPRQEGEASGADDSLRHNVDYFMLEERFRGDKQQIRERQRVYVSYFSDRKRVLDLGCGRGEFLELMRENGIGARGVDANLDMVLLGKERGLDVTHGDLFAYLDSLPPNSLDGVFCAQVIEHLHWGQIISLIKLCHNRLIPGAPLVLETVNPECLMVFARAFYMDPTHRRPVHPQTLRFALESAGFASVEFRYLAPVECHIPSLEWPGLTNEQQKSWLQAVESLNRTLFGYQDFAAVGRKKA